MPKNRMSGLADLRAVAGWFDCIESRPTAPRISRALGLSRFRQILRSRELNRWAEDHGYETRHGPRIGGLRLQNDCDVGYFRGEYDGRPVVFIRWSAIESIWWLEDRGLPSREDPASPA